MKRETKDIDNWIKNEGQYSDYSEKLYIENGNLVYVGTIQKAYWLENSSEFALGYRTEGETIKMTMEEMKASNFVDILNANITGDNELKQWKIDVNGEYPHF